MLTTTCVATAVAALTLADTVLADEPRKQTEPLVLTEPSEITQVVDAFDGDDVFDLHLSLGFQHTSRSGKIRRESSVLQSGLPTGGGYTARNMNVAEYSESTNRLLTRADIGIYKDLSLVIRVPIILSNDRKLEGLDGSENQQALVLQGAPGEQLFRLPFNSPTRSGVEYLAVGIDAGIMNQARDPTKPTWVVGIEGRFNVSEPMHACNDNPAAVNLDSSVAQESCAHPSDVNRNGRAGDVRDADNRTLEGTFSGGREPGVSRGTTGLHFHTYVSRRIKYIEPYGGFETLFEFPTDSSDYGIQDLRGSLVNHPPLRGSMLIGLNIIPWEVRDQFQRIAFDLRFKSTYVSEGRDYSELFDALGSSDAPLLRTPNFSEYQQDPNSDASIVNPNSQKVYVTGLTDVQQHAVYSVSAQFTWQAGEYVKFNLGGSYTVVQSHLVAFDQPCNPSFASEREKSGPCRREGNSTGIPNPNYRKTINEPGRRFSVDDSHAFDGWINATVMF